MHSRNMSDADYYTSGPDSRSSHGHSGYAGYSQPASRSRPSPQFDLQAPIPDPSYDNLSPGSTFVTSPLSTYTHSNYMQSVESQQAILSWHQDTLNSSLAGSAAMDPSQFFLPMGDGGSIFPRYVPMDRNAAYLERCDSPCAESCKSQCGEDGEADICVDPDCDDVAADICTDTSCTDQVSCSSEMCPVVELSSGDEDAAATLASIGASDPSASPGADGELSTQVRSSLRLAPSASPQSSFMASPPLSGHYADSFPSFFPQQPMTMGFYPILPGDLNMNLDLVDDLMTYHNPQQQSHSTPHFRPCPLDNAPLLTRRCMLPRAVYPEVEAQSLSHIEEANNYNLLSGSCGVYLSGPDEVLPHIANNHPQAFTTLQSYLEANTPAHGRNETNKAALLSAIEAMGPPRPVDMGNALLDPYSTTPSSTPYDSATPPTHGSDATLDTVDLASRSAFSCQWQEDSGRTCGQHFDDAESLHKHVITHSRSLKKSVDGHRCRWVACSRAAGPKGCFPQRTKLERHLQTHTGFKPAECSICGLALSGAQALAQHMRTHTNETPWKCPFEGCGKEFKQQSALTMHTRTHTDEKPLACDICGKRFSESSNLSKHKKIHSRSFKCRICNKDFSRADQLRKHEKLHEAAGEGGLLSKTYKGRVTKAKAKA